MLRKLLSLICFMCLSVPVVFAQSGSISGTVTDAKTGEPVASANIYIQQINRGAATNVDGEYSITSIPVGTYKIRVTFVGYKANIQQVQVQEGENELNVALKPGSLGLDELVVTATGPQSKRSISTSVASVGAKEFEKVPLEDASSILQGRAAGVQATQTSGNPGSGLQVRVRGQGSINAGSRPLYIVDGVQVSFTGQSGLVTESPLNGINPDNIQSISVLKDAAATALYGAQGANGVVLITTKRGQKGNTQVSATVERGARSNIKNVDYFNRDQFLEYFGRAAANSYGAQYAEPFLRDVLIPRYGLGNTPQNASPFNGVKSTYKGSFSDLPNTDWTDFNNRTGVTQNYKMSISGGSDDVQYLLSGGYQGSEGHIKTYKYQNYHLRSNVDYQVSSRFSTSFNLSLSNQKTNGTCQDGFFTNCPVSQQGFIAPLAHPYNDDGSYSTGFPLVGATNNPALIYNNVLRNTSTVHLLGDLKGTYDFAKWISLTTQFGMDWRQVRDERFDSPIAAPATNGQKIHRLRTSPNFNTSTYLKLNKSFDRVNNVSAQLGFDYRRDFERFIGASTQQFLGSTINIGDGGATPSGTGGFTNEYRKAGYYANVKYNYDQRYFVNVTGRYEGSSRFGANDRFGFFPGISAAWGISSEDFFNVDWINDLKIRASYGQSGNSLIGRYAALGLYSIGGSYTGTAGLGPSQIANPDLTWETATTFNFGLDWSMFAGRLRGSLDAYTTDHSDLLLDRPLPHDSGYFSLTKNVGKTNNKGVELQLNSVNVRAGDFQWSTSFNVAVQKNEVKELAGGQDALNPASSEPIAVGHSIHALKLVRGAGINPADGRPFWYDGNGNLTYNPVFSRDAKFIKGDGGEQDVVGGFGNTFNYKGFSLNVFFQYSFGQVALPQQVWFFNVAQIGSTQDNGIVDALDNSWSHQGQFAKYPYPQIGTSSYPETAGFSQGSSNAYFDASYIRLKNASISYSLPSSVSNALHLRNLQIYASGLNLITWTSYLGFDPEVAGDGGGTTAQSASYPAARVINGGISIDF